MQRYTPASSHVHVIEACPSLVFGKQPALPPVQIVSFAEAILYAADGILKQRSCSEPSCAENAVLAETVPMSASASKS
jgi:hypothetical protein